MIGFEMAACSGGPRLVQPWELLAGSVEETRRRRRPFQWQVKVPFAGEQHEAPVNPDYVFALEQSSGRWDVFCLEADSGSEVQIPKSSRAFGKATIYRKCLGFDVSRQQGIVEQRTGIRGFRVLFVTSGGKDRATNIAATARTACAGKAPGLVLTTTLDEVRAHGPHGAAWINARGEVAAL